MHRALFAVLILPALLLAAPTQPMTVLPDEITPVQTGAALTGPALPSTPAGGGSFPVGAVDTVGGTTYDWQTNGPALQMLVNSPGHGVHVLWMYSASTSGTTFPDRNMRYNYYDYDNHAWNWIDPDFMQSGVNVFTYRTGFGSLEAVPSTGAAVVSAHHSTTTIAPVLGRDAEAGAGIFDYLAGEPTIDGYEWAFISIGSQEYYQLAMVDATSSDHLFHGRSTNFVNWGTPESIPHTVADELFPTHGIATSNVMGSQKVVITWTASEEVPSTGFYRLSTDGGTTWGTSTQIPFPAAFGTDTVTSFHITSIYPMFDHSDKLHVVANVMPYISGSGYIIPAQVWHWCPDNTPNWSRITIATCNENNLGAAVGYNAMYADRPSLGQDANGNLFVAWEQFDSANVEPGPPERLRADIFTSNSTNNGQTWTFAQKITNAGTTSCRFPSMLDNIADTVMVSYIIDQKAGFFLYAENVATSNPVVVQKWVNPYAGGIGGGKRADALRMTASATPNPFSRSARISYEVPKAGNAVVRVYDITGRPARTLVSGHKEPGRYSAAWDGCDDAGSRLPSGVYLYRYSLGKDRVTGKLMLTD